MDATDLDRAEAEGRLDALDLAVAKLDGTGRILRCNPAMVALLGRPDATLPGRDLFRDAAPATDQPAFRGRFLEGVRRGRLAERFGFVLGAEADVLRLRVAMADAAEPGTHWLAFDVAERLPSPRAQGVLTVGRRARGEEVAAETCEREPIHLLGGVQPHGVLLAADPTTAGLRITACSANAADALGAGPDALLGRALDVALPSAAVDELRRALAAGNLLGGQAVRLRLSLDDPPRPFELTAHLQAGRLVLELEAAPARREDFGCPCQADTRDAVARLRAAPDLPALAAELARTARDLTGFERVLVYRFHPDWSGEVVGEALAPDWGESLLGLRFPASDIPAQARALYLVSRSRFVPDRDAAAVPVLAAPGADGGGALDLTHAQFRALSPVHLEYQRALGVDGSMSVSIVVEGRLWGLLIGHHRRPRYVPPEARGAVAVLADAFALRAHEIEEGALRRHRQEQLRVQATLLAQLAGADDPVSALTAGPATLLDLFDATGAAVVEGRDVAAIGATPPAAALRELADWVRARGGCVATDQLARDCPALAAHRHLASGLLAAAVDEEGQRLLLWLRPEVAATVVWGGDPRKPVLADAATATVMPRRSFERWVEERTGRSEPWAAWDVEIARELAGSVEGVALRRSRRLRELGAKQEELLAALAEKEALLRQKDLLTREIDHRVKNSLQIVGSFLRTQSNAVTDPAARDALAQTYGRVMSVARVHGSLYGSGDVERVDLGQTIARLCGDLAGVGGDRRQVEVDAEAGLMVPYRTAVSLSLVATELITNAFKYAYAPDEAGTVEVSVGPGADGGGVRVRVCDRGRGLPAGWTDRPQRGLGMRLVRAMLDQIGATLDVEGDGGTCFTVSA